MSPPPKMSATEADFRNDVRAEEDYNDKINEIVDVLSSDETSRQDLDLERWKNLCPRQYDLYRIKAVKVYRLIRSTQR